MNPLYLLVQVLPLLLMLEVRDKLLGSIRHSFSVIGALLLLKSIGLYKFIADGRGSTSGLRHVWDLFILHAVNPFVEQRIAAIFAAHVLAVYVVSYL